MWVRPEPRERIRWHSSCGEQMGPRNWNRRSRPLPGRWHHLDPHHFSGAKQGPASTLLPLRKAPPDLIRTIVEQSHPAAKEPGKCRQHREPAGDRHGPRTLPHSAPLGPSPPLLLAALCCPSQWHTASGMTGRNNLEKFPGRGTRYGLGREGRTFQVEEVARGQEHAAPGACCCFLSPVPCVADSSSICKVPGQTFLLTPAPSLPAFRLLHGEVLTDASGCMWSN